MTPVKADQENVIYGPPTTGTPLTYSLGQIYLENLEKYRERIAIIDPATNTTLTYGEFKIRSIRVALEMRARGVKKGDFVTVCGKNQIHINLPVLAGLYLGASINPLHPSYSQNEFKIMFGKTEPKMIFCDESCYDELKTIITSLKLKTEFVIFEKDFGPFLAPHAGENTFTVEPVDPAETIAFVMCSSGTTGLVKGVIVTHKSLYVALVEYEELALPNDVMLLYSPLSWVSAIWILGLSIQSGIARIITEYDPDENINIMTKYKVTWAFFTPQKLTEVIQHPLFAKSDIPQILRTVLFGGSAASLEQIKEYRRALPNIYMFNGYGSSEMCGAHAFFGRDDHELNKEKISSAGKVIKGGAAKIIDGETQQTLGRNQPGEFLVKGPSMTKGYYKDPEATAKAIDKDGWFHTGDIGYFDDDDCLFIIGRSKELLKYKGWQVAPAEIETVIDNHPDVKKSCVIGLPHKTDGDLPLAFVQKHSGRTITEEELVDYVNARVVDLQKLRGGVRFIDEIPMTPTGKMRRMDLQKFLPLG